MAPIEKDSLTMRISTVISAIAFGVLVSGAAYAANYGLDAAAPAAPSAAAPATPSAADIAAEKAKSDECYKQADLKGLHKDERKKFHRQCVEGK